MPFQRARSIAEADFIHAILPRSPGPPGKASRAQVRALTLAALGLARSARTDVAVLESPAIRR